MSATPVSSAPDAAPRAALSDSAFPVLAGVTFIDGLGASIVLPLLPFIMLAFGAQPALVAQLVGFYSLASVIGNPVLGRLSDRIGRPPVVIVTLFGTMLAYIGIVFSWSLAGVFAFRVMSGFISGRSAIVRALATDGTDPETQVRRIGTLSAWTAIGVSVGPSLATLVALMEPTREGQYRSTLLVAVGLCLIATLAFIACTGRPRLMPAAVSPAGGASTKLMPLVRTIRFPLIMTAMAAYADGVMLSVSALFAQERFGWGVVETGWLISAMTAGVAGARLFLMHRLVGSLGAATAIGLALGCAGAGLLAMAYAQSAPAFVLASALYASGVGLANMLPAVIITRTSPAEHRGLALGLNQALMALSIFVATSANGLLFQYVRPEAPHLVAATVALLGAAIAVGHRRRAHSATTAGGRHRAAGQTRSPN